MVAITIITIVQNACYHVIKIINLNTYNAYILVVLPDLYRGEVPTMSIVWKHCPVGIKGTGPG